MRAAVVLLLCLLLSVPAFAAERFKFDNIETLDAMQKYIRRNFPPGSAREDLQKAFVLQGRGSLRHHPSQRNVEKYLYDINLCKYYVWRWNISADFDPEGKLIQAYVNGLPVFPNAPVKKPSDFSSSSGGKTRLSRMSRDWPQATKGAKQVYYMLLDMDGNDMTLEDQSLVGMGPSRADPANFGQLVKYSEIDPWRSIFDDDLADDIYDYKGDCRKADAQYLSKTIMEPQHGVLK
jgi:hypothetical protein